LRDYSFQKLRRKNQNNQIPPPRPRMIQEATQEDAEIIVQEQKELSPRW
jgi:hypothetical protein